MPKVYKSGYQKRKAKKEELAAISKLPKLDFFLTKKTESTEVEDEETLAASSSGDLQSQINEIQDNLEKEFIEERQEPALESQVSTLPPESDNYEDDLDEQKEKQDDQDLDILSTDRGLFPLDITNTKLKRIILSKGSHRPKGPFPRDSQQNGRCFSESYYNKKSQAGLSISLTWLCYSNILDSAYCEPCWLFASRNCSTYNEAWIRGIRDWGHLHDRIQSHEVSHQHLTACVVFQKWRSNDTLDAQQERDILKMKNFWRLVLERIISTTLTMASCNLAFRGHRESADKPNSGNFLSIIQLLAKYDPVLKQLLEKKKGTVKYLSHQIQDEIIDLLADTIKTQLVNEIKSAPFFSVIMDTTQDISKTDQLSQIIRYITINTNSAGIPIEIKINESFLGFRQITDSSAAGLENEIINSIEEKGLNLIKCRGQGYDGAATMSGVYSGVQARISKKEPRAEYVHCAAHNLNLALNDCVQNIAEIKNYYNIIEQLYTYFGQSIKRWAMLKELSSVAEIVENKNITLKRLCPTRWSSRHKALVALRFRYLDVIKGLTKINLLSKKSDERTEASGLKKHLEKFEFVFLTIFQTKLLEIVDAVSISLQSKDMQLDKAVNLLNDAIKSLSQIRDSFEDMKQTAIEISVRWGVQPKFQDKRIKKVKKHFDELCEDERLTDSEKYFKVNIFYNCLDVINNQLKNRFRSLKGVAQRFEIIFPKKLNSVTDEELYEKAMILVNHYKTDISLKFPAQLLSFRTSLKQTIATKSTVYQLAHLLIIENSTLSSNYPELVTVLILFLTIPVTTATAERSFSKLKLIKNYLRSTMMQERLSSLSIISIENENARKINLDDVIDAFAEKKARKKLL